MWKKLVETEETLSFEKKTKEFRVIIEARKDGQMWSVVKKYVPLLKGMDFMEEYFANSQTEARDVVKTLQSERVLKSKDIEVINKYKKKAIRMDIRRSYKELNVEKWDFSLNDNFANSVIIHEGQKVEMDIMMNEKYKYIEEKIIFKLMDALGISEFDSDVEQNVFYFAKRSNFYVDAPTENISIEKLKEEF